MPSVISASMLLVRKNAFRNVGMKIKFAAAAEIIAKRAKTAMGAAAAGNLPPLTTVGSHQKPIKINSGSMEGGATIDIPVNLAINGRLVNGSRRTSRIH